MAERSVCGAPSARKKIYETPFPKAGKARSLIALHFVFRSAISTELRCPRLLDCRSGRRFRRRIDGKHNSSISLPASRLTGPIGIASDVQDLPGYIRLSKLYHRVRLHGLLRRTFGIIQ